MQDYLNELIFVFQRLDWAGVLDIVLVTVILYGILLMVRDTQAVVLLRGVIIIIILLTLLTSLINLPAFSWLVQTALPALLVAIPVIFAPEIRRALGRLGRAGAPSTLPFRSINTIDRNVRQMLNTVITAAVQLSSLKYGALIVLRRSDNLGEFARTGVRLNSEVTPELLLQIFYPNTPLHDGAVIISDSHVSAAACVMPLSASGVLTSTPDRKIGLRHRASIGISEASDAIAVVVSEETGAISIAHNGRLIRYLEPDRLENLLLAFYRPTQFTFNPIKLFRRMIRSSPSVFRED